MAAGGGDLGAFAAFYDRAAPAVRGLLRSVLDDAGAVRAPRRAYEHLWRHAPSFDPGAGSAYSPLMSVARRELMGPIHDLRRPAVEPAPRGDTPMADG